MSPRTAAGAARRPRSRAETAEAVRRSAATAPEVLLTAKTQRWAPEETLRVLVEPEIAARDESNTRNRMTAARFPVDKTLDEFNLAESSIPQSHPRLPVHPRLDRAARQPLPRRTRRHRQDPLPHRARHGRRRRRAPGPLLHRRRAHRAPLPRPRRQHRRQEPSRPARNDLIIIDEIGFAPLDHTGCQLLFRLIAAAYERRSVAIASHWPFDHWGRFLPDHPTAVASSTGSATTPTSSPPTATATA